MKTDVLRFFPKIKPNKPKQTRFAPVDADWIFELKYDGWRGIAYIHRGEVLILSKQSKNPDALSHLERRIAACAPGASAILDGEVCYLDPQGRPIRRGIQGNRNSLVLMAFDILWLDGEDLRDLPLRDRKRFLAKFVKKGVRHIIFPVSRFEGKPDEFFRAIHENGLEGMIAKKLSDSYYGTWWKIKVPGYASPPFVRSSVPPSKVASNRAR